MFIVKQFILNIGSAKYLLFWKMIWKKKLLNIFSNFSFYLKIQSFRLIMENNLIQMAASAGHAAISSIFMHIIDSVQLYFNNGFKKKNGSIMPRDQNPHQTVSIRKKNHLFRWCSFWSWRVRKQAKLSHLEHQTATRFGCVGISMYAYGFSVPQRHKTTPECISDNNSACK